MTYSEQKEKGLVALELIKEDPEKSSEAQSPQIDIVTSRYDPVTGLLGETERLTIDLLELQRRRDATQRDLDDLDSMIQDINAQGIKL